VYDVGYGLDVILPLIEWIEVTPDEIFHLLDGKGITALPTLHIAYLYHDLSGTCQ
jgi:hypothetical protein